MTWGYVHPSDNVKDVVKFCANNNIVPLLSDEVLLVPGECNVYHTTPASILGSTRPGVPQTNLGRLIMAVNGRLAGIQLLCSFHYVSKGVFGECGQRQLGGYVQIRGGYVEMVGMDRQGCY